MVKARIGIPRPFFCYNEGKFLKLFLEELGYEVIVSSKTDKEIIELGSAYSNDEMCMSLKLFLGHVASLQKRCDYIINIRFANAGIHNQGCTNYLSTYDLVNNLFDQKIININIDHHNYKTLYKELLSIFSSFKIDKKRIKNAYLFSKIKISKERKKEIIFNTNKLYNDDKKVLLVSHAYNLYDEYISTPIVRYLEKNNIKTIYSDKFDNDKLNELGENISKDLYWKYSRENIGAVELCKPYVDGVIFISSFPCNLDSMVNEMSIRQLEIPYLNLVIDDINSLVGIETRLESFVDIIEQK